jgi:hypothetical protein
VQELKKRGVTDIVQVGTGEEDRHGGGKNLTRMVSLENRIEYNSLYIDCSEPEALIQQTKEALLTLDKLLESEESIVYLFSNKDVLLAPMLVALYLSIHKGIYLRMALEFVKEKYPVTEIDENIMGMVYEIAQFNDFQQMKFQQNRETIANRMETISKT